MASIHCVTKQVPHPKWLAWRFLLLRLRCGFKLWKCKTHQCPTKVDMWKAPPGELKKERVMIEKVTEGDEWGGRRSRSRRRRREGNLVGVCYCSGQRAQTLSFLGDHSGGWERVRERVRGRGVNCKRLRDYNAQTGSGLQGRAVNKRTKALLNPRFSYNSVHAHYASVCNPALDTSALSHISPSRTQMFSCLSCSSVSPPPLSIQPSSANNSSPPGASQHASGSAGNNTTAFSVSYL